MQSKLDDTSSAASKRKALGRGLSALLPERSAPAAPAAAGQPDAETVRKISIDLIDPNPYQPRQVFRQQSIEELAQSIRVDGLIQPIMVQPRGGRYSLIVGERRWRAARLAGLAEIPAIVKEVEPDRLLEVTLVENIQREDLNPIEVAMALSRMSRELSLSHEELASRTGKDRTTITNLLRLLKLPKDVQELVADRRISVGHARALLALETAEQQRALAEKAAGQGLSVRQVERIVRDLVEPRKATKQEQLVDPNVAAALEQLERTLGTRVRLVQKRRDQGRLEIEYYSSDDLERIYQIIVGEVANSEADNSLAAGN